MKRQIKLAIFAFSVASAAWSYGFYLERFWTAREAALSGIGLIFCYVLGIINALQIIRSERRCDDDELDSLFYSGSPGQISAERERGKP